MNSKKFAGCVALAGSAFLWATAYVAVKQMVDEVQPGLLLALRFSLAAIILVILSVPRKRYFNRQALSAGVKMGVALFAEFFFFTVGLKYTTASKSSFIIASYIILLPIAYYIIRKKAPTKADIIASVVCMIGLLFIFGNGLNGFNIGDVLCIGSAIAYAVHIVYSAQYAKKYDGMMLNTIQIATAAVLAVIVTLISLAMGLYQINWSIIPAGSIFYLALVCTIAPYFLCLLGMKHVSTTTSGILLSFECVFATLLAAIFLKEKLYWQLIVGGAFILLSFILSEVLRAYMGKKEKQSSE